MTQQNDPGIVDPAGYLTRHALVTFDGQGRAATVGQAMPLPVTPHMFAAAATPLAGSTDVSGSFGPFVPDLGRPIWLTLAGNWTGSAVLLRSVDGGATRLPLTVGGEAWASFTANAQEVVGEESVAGCGYYLDVALTAGTLTFEVRQ